LHGELVADTDAGTAALSRWQFKDPLRGAWKNGAAPWLQAGPYGLHPQISVKCNHVDGKSHTQGMNGGARAQEQAVFRTKDTFPQKTLQPR
jgi:predicted double-glycine peptidase